MSRSLPQEMQEHVARELGPSLEAAAQSRDAAAVGVAAGRLAGLLAELEALIEGSGMGSGAEGAAWIQVRYTLSAKKNSRHQPQQVTRSISSQCICICDGL